MAVLQCVAVCCSVLQCVAVCCSVLHITRMSHRMAHSYVPHESFIHDSPGALAAAHSAAIHPRTRSSPIRVPAADTARRRACTYFATALSWHIGMSHGTRMNESCLAYE